MFSYRILQSLIVLRQSDEAAVDTVQSKLQRNSPFRTFCLKSANARSRTHDSTYTLYRLGERLSTGARLYVETGRADGLDTDGDSPNSLHSFAGPPIPQGEGTSVTRAFLDGNHTLISIMARINPSPDWFVGVDSFQLCVEGNWVDTVTVELREYTLTESYHEDDVLVEFVSNDNLQANSEAPRGIDPNRDLNEAIAEERREMDTQRYRYWSTAGSGQQVVTDVPRDNKAAIINSIASSYASWQRPRYNVTPMPRTSKIVTVNGDKTRQYSSETGRSDWPYYHTYRRTAEAQKAQIYEDIQRKITNASNVSSIDYSFASNATNLADQRQHRLRMKHHGLTSKGKRVRTRAPRDCKVGEWGAWSACSRSCGVGETQRTRKVTIKPRRGGVPCPPLKETKWCGSANPCISESKPIEYHW
ncbi:hypothetical protein ACFW04_000884 [Cataglyphis niger]